MSLKKRHLKGIFTFVTFFALAITAFMLRDQIIQTIRNLRDANLWLIILIVPLAAFNHFCQGQLYRGLFAVLGDRFRSKAMMRLSLELNFVNNVFPSAGVSGFSYLSIRMRGEGISAAKATLVQMMRFIMLFISFQLLLGLGLVLLAFGGQANDFVLLVAGGLFTLLLVGTLLIGFVIGSKSRIEIFFTGLTRVVNRLIHIVRPKHPETINIERLRQVLNELHNNYKRLRDNMSRLKRPLLFASLANICEVTSILLVFAAFGQFVNPGAVIIAYAVANFAGLVSVLPGGVGIYEGLMTAVFAAAGVPAGLSLPVILAFRVLSISAQLPVGYFFYQKNLQTAPVNPKAGY